MPRTDGRVILLIDNYDSFTYNLVHYLGEVGAQTRVVRNDQLTTDDALAMGAEAVVISPGPCDPSKAGICLDLVTEAAPKLPILGVCLGHQVIGQAFGGVVERAGRLMHGKTSRIVHDAQGVFAGVPSPFTAMRYHSLVVNDRLPDCLVATAWSEDRRELMGVRHRALPIEGVQFHPESFMTEHGHQMLRNFLAFGRAGAA